MQVAKMGEQGGKGMRSGVRRTAKAAVLEASYAAQTETARAHEEEDMLRQVGHGSRASHLGT